MPFSGDDRAAAIQIGAMLLFAALVISMAGYQATVVPDQNKEIEFNHNQEAQNQLQDLRNGIVSTAGGSGGSAHSVSLGTSYPARTFFVNPGRPSGQLRTLGRGEVVIENATATAGGSVGQYWNGANRTLNTTAFAYRPNYNELNDAPATVYEHSLLYNAHPTGANTTVADQVLVDGDEITLVTLEGDLQESTSGTVSVNVRTESGPANTVTVTNDSGPIRIRIPTRSPDAWNQSLPAHAAITDTTDAGDYTVATITLDPSEYGSYDLRMARARLGDGSGGASPDAEAEYVVVLDDGGPVVAEVRDRFNNPVSNATVQYETDSDSGTANTDDRGRVEVPAADGETVEGWINASSYGDAATYERFRVTVPASGGGGGGGGAYSVNWRDPCTDSCTWDLGADSDDELDLRTALSDDIGGMTVEFGVNNDTVGTVTDSSAQTDSNGDATTRLRGHENGTVGVYAASGGSSDVISIEIVNASGGGGGGNAAPTASFTYSPSDPMTGETVTFDGSGSSDPEGDDLTYEWDFDGDGTYDQTTAGATVQHSYADDGNYSTTLRVTDAAGNADTATETVSVQNHPPTASFTWTCGNGNSCDFDAGGSGDPDGSVSTYSWEFGDGATGSGQTATHTYSPPGTYQVTLTVTDDDGDTDRVTKTVTTGGGLSIDAVQTTNGDNSRVRLTYSSSRNDGVNVTHVKVNETQNQVDELDGSRYGSPEIAVDVGQTGTADDAADITAVTLPVNVSMTGDGTTATVGSGEVADLELVEFRSNQGQGGPADMTMNRNQPFTITVYYESNGRTYSITQSVSP